MASSDIIKLLPDSVANQIAAGEVIQRPASVVKELVENAIDAGATAVSIIIKDAGRTLIQVIDNGSGMSPTDARMAFERHATSKINSAEDLFNLHTMGFRGEALASIAAVAQVELRTMRRDDNIGFRLTIAATDVEGEPCACVPGTNLMVKNLFAYQPARRKYLKKDSVELSHILHEFERLALVNTEVDFTLTHNDAVLHRLLHGSLRQRIGELFGKALEKQIIPIATETSLVRLSGYVGLPQFARRRGAHQYLFVNGRNMRHPFFHKAILKCYEHLIAPDAQPAYFINFEVDPSTIDVNIHPQKHEIKFEHEQAIWQILEAAVRETLGKTQAAGALDFDIGDAPEIPLFDPNAEASIPVEDIDESYNPFRAASDNTHHSAPAATAGGFTFRPSVPRPQQDWEKLYENFSDRRADALSATASAAQQTFETPALEPTPAENLFATDTPALPASSCMQFRDSYIITGSHSGLMLIHQRRAHIRILFERYLDTISQGAMASQSLIFAEDFEVSPSQDSLLTDLQPRLEQLGFRFTRATASNWCITAVPAPLNSANPSEVVFALLAEAETGTDAADALNRPLAAALARSSAIKTNRPLSGQEMETIVADLFRCAEPSFTPDGLPVISIIDNDHIASLFNPSL